MEELQIRCVTVHSVTSNTLRDAQKRQKTPFRAAALGFSVTSATLHSQKNWRESFRKAEQHGDTEIMVIEQFKLKTAEEIKNAFLVLKEGSL